MSNEVLMAFIWTGFALLLGFIIGLIFYNSRKHNELKTAIDKKADNTTVVELKEQFKSLGQGQDDIRNELKNIQKGEARLYEELLERISTAVEKSIQPVVENNKRACERIDRIYEQLNAKK